MRARFVASYFAVLVTVYNPLLFGQIVTDHGSAESHIGDLPLVFEPNRGQADRDVHFLSRGADYTVLLETDKTVFMLPPGINAQKDGERSQPSVVSLELLHSNRGAKPEALDLLPGKSNYFIGNRPATWISGIPQYEKAAFRSIYPGIDVVYYGNAGRLEYDFIVAAGSDPTALGFRVTGAESVRLNDRGDLSLKVANVTVELDKPIVYQEIAGVRHNINGGFVFRGADTIGIAVAKYDTSKPLIIDPVLCYSTLIGANNSTQVQGVAIDSLGNFFVTGTTYATNYPTVNAFQPTNKGYSDIFVTKLNSTGSAILYSTYLGGSGFDNSSGIAVDLGGNAYVTGTVGSSDFPTTPGAFMTTCPGICNTPFVSKFLSDGTLAFSTYMGGSNSPAHAIAVDTSGEAYIAGNTASNDLPTTPGSFDPTYAGLLCTSCYNGYVEKLNASGTALLYSTYFGLAGYGGVPSTIGTGIAVDSGGSAYLVGNTAGIPVKNPIEASNVGNAFITKFSPDGSSLVYSTYFGGGNDYATGVAVDAFGNVHVTGTSSSCQFPLGLNALSTDCVTMQYDQKVFVVTLNASGSSVLFSTFLRSGNAAGIAVDKLGNTYVTGTNTSSNLPTLNSIESTSQQASSIGFVSELDLTGKLLFSTYLGATGGGSQPIGIAVDKVGGIYVAGAAQGDFPLLHPIHSQTIQNTNYTLFLAKISPANKSQFSLSPRISPVLALRNTSSVPLTISAITPSSNFTKGGNCNSSLPPGTGCTLILQGAADNKTSGTVTITSNAYSAPQQFVIAKSRYGDGVGSILSIFPLYLRFSAQLIGTTSGRQEIVIANSGLLPAAINSIQMIQPSAFAESDNCPTTLNAGSSCTVSVTYTAATQGDTAQLAIVADPSQTRYTAYLSGIGSTSAIALSTSSVGFGSQFVGAAPLGRIVNIANATPYFTSIPSISVSTGFAQSNTCSAPLAPQASCRASVTYKPSANENATGSLTVGGLGPGGPASASLFGTGLIVSDLAFSPMPLNLYATVNEPAPSGVITLTNTSQSAVVLSGFKMSGPFSQSNNCHGGLVAGASCKVTVAFHATRSGVFNGNVSISNSGPNSPQTLPLVGTAETQLSISPTVVDFGQQNLNVKVVGYFGMGNGKGYSTVTVSSVTVQGADFTLPTNPCPLSYPPYLGCGAWEVDFKPSQIGVRTGTVTVVANDSAFAHVITLQGTGVSNGRGTLSNTGFDFGTQTVGTQSQPQQVSVTNTGTGVLKLAGISASQQFAQTNNCGASLAAGASCTISIKFAPTLQGILDGTVSVQDDGLGSPHTITLGGIGQ